jgi:hypothetical protein
VTDAGTDVKLSDWITKLLAGTVTNVGMTPAPASGDSGAD